MNEDPFKDIKEIFRQSLIDCAQKQKRLNELDMKLIEINDLGDQDLPKFYDNEERDKAKREAIESEKIKEAARIDYLNILPWKRN
jgi:hypothetical protein